MDETDRRAVAYLRVSSPSQATAEELLALGIRRRKRLSQASENEIRDDPQSLSRQRERVYRIAAEQGLEIVGEPFIDVASGWKDTLTRKAWSAMRQLCDARSIRVIICFDVSRFGRAERLLELGDIAGWLQQNQVRLIGGGHDYRLGLDSSADLVFLLQMWSHGADSARHSRNMIDAYAALRGRRLHPCSQRPFGYAKSKGEFDGVAHSCLTPEPSEASVVREVFARVADGDSCKAVAADLERRGVRSVRGGMWTHAHIKAMIRRPLYMGKHLFDGVLDDVRNAESLVPALLWQQANAELERRGELYKRQRQTLTTCGATTTGRGGLTSAVALFDGLLVCAGCGANLMISQSHRHTLADGTPTRYIYYRCRTAYHHQPGCDQASIPERIVTAHVAEHAEEFFGAHMAEARQQVADDRSEGIRARLVTVQSMIERFNAVLLSEREVDVERLLAGSEKWFREEAQLLDDLRQIECASPGEKDQIAIDDVAQVMQSRQKLKQCAQQCIDHLLVRDKAVVGHVLRLGRRSANGGLFGTEADRPSVT